jgi:DNA polymerase-2
MNTGWLYDIYPLDDKIILWIKNKKIQRIEKQWTPSLYVTSENKNKLDKLQHHTKIIPFIKNCNLVNKIEQVSDRKESKVLEITVKFSEDLLKLAKIIEQLDRFGVYRLYNVDVPPEQTFMYEHDIFPLGKYKLGNNLIAQSEIDETDYKLPHFTKINLKINAKNKQKIPKFADPIESIQINDIIIQSDSEIEMILDCVKIVKDIDPDFIFTDKGDSWDFPYLASRAQTNQIVEKLILGRENHTLVSKKYGTSYYSYGQVHFKPSPTKLLGRIHIDRSNCFVWENEDSIEAIFEISRTCKLPMQTAARASIGKCMSSVQFYNATKRNLLIPWKPTVAEIFKNRMDLLVGDRGGLILEPRIGAYENVGELDFASLFGNIMLKKNISAETIDCKCCPDSEQKVPDLGYHICKKLGIVPQSLELLLEKRKKYTQLIETTKDKEKLKTYVQRKAALKWILVTSFGYLGFNNAKFGRIDAHMAVCAFARQLLLQAISIAERNRFQVLHGIVDSMWVYKKNATKEDFDLLRRQISTETGFELSLDVYNWIVFLSSKDAEFVPVANRYFGANINGELKMRGIETRRRDTPNFFKKCQLEILNLFASCKTISDVKNVISNAKEIQKQYTNQIYDNHVSLEELVFTNKVTRGTGQHKSNTIQADTVNQLLWEGKTIEPGQKIRYFIHDYARKISKRVIPIEIAKPEDRYDAKRYVELLDKCCKSVIEPFLSEKI